MKLSRLFSIILLLIFIGCKSVKIGNYYENRLTKVRVMVVFAGDESSLIKKFGRKFEYQYNSQDSHFVVYTSNPNYNPYGDELEISSEKRFLSDYAIVP